MIVMADGRIAVIIYFQILGFKCSLILFAHLFLGLSTNLFPVTDEHLVVLLICIWPRHTRSAKNCLS